MGERRLLVGIVTVSLLVGAVIWAVLSSSSLPDGPVPVAWDAVRCARCGMLVSEPGFAAQLHTEDGRILIFDDPGCLLVYIHDEAPEVQAVWMHHHVEDRWLPPERVAFEDVGTSPMGYGLAAFERGEVPEALEWADAVSWTLAREAARSAGGVPAGATREPAPEIAR